MALGDATRRLFEKYSKVESRINRTIIQTQREATTLAIIVATENTPNDTDGKPRGLNALTGDSYLSWGEDSQPIPMVIGNNYITTLANTTDYISFVNDGHILDRHFVPHLFKNSFTGLLDNVYEQSGGIIVGTVTPYIPGLYMKELAIDAYQEHIYNTLGKGVVSYIVSSSLL